jgi:uncharacterized protein
MNKTERIVPGGGGFRKSNLTVLTITTRSCTFILRTWKNVKNMSIGLLILHLRLPDCTSLKDKRGHIKPILSRLHREFNVSAAEIDLLDQWHQSVLAICFVSNDSSFTIKVLQRIIVYTELTWPNVEIIKQKIELI